MQKFNRIVEEVLAHPMAFCLPQMPTNRCGLVNGSKIVAVKDYPFFGKTVATFGQSFSF